MAVAFKKDSPIGAADDFSKTVTVRVPIAIRKRGGKKLVLTPAGEEYGSTQLRAVDNTMVKAIARAFRWQAKLESGQYATIAELASREKISKSYVGRLLSLTLLAPATVEAILEGAHMGLTLAEWSGPVASVWEEQARLTT